MNEHLFYEAIKEKAAELGISPLLIMSGVEGLYTFRNIEMNELNYEFLDNLILTILALRIGDSFHTIAEQNLSSSNNDVMQAAALELRPLNQNEIDHSANPYLQSFANIVAENSVIRGYHVKALEAAAREVQLAQERFGNNSIGAIIMSICNNGLGDKLDLASLFSQ